MISDNKEFWIVVLSSVILILIYSVFFIEFNRKPKAIAFKSNEFYVYLQRLTGVITFGIFPLGIMNYVLPTALSDYGTELILPYKSLFWFAILSAIVVVLNLVQAKKENNLEVYPQIRVRKWNARVYILSALSWSAYLLAYEFFFRGFLFYAALRMTGLYWAVAINVVFYALAHVPKGKFETIGAIPLGILLCIMTYITGSFWVAFGVHVVMALSNEWLSLYYHRTIKQKQVASHTS